MLSFSRLKLLEPTALRYQVSHTYTSRLLRSRAFSLSRRPGRRPIFLVLESLETRQLLSVGSVGSNQIVAQPNVGATPLVSSPKPIGLAPTQVRQAYGIDQVTFQKGTIPGDGSGQTIALVVAYDDPNIGSDLRQFDRQYGLPDPPSFTKYVQTGLRQSDPGWSLETALDVEWAHAIAPKANLVLVEARTASFSDLFYAVDFARSLSGVVAVSMSWGSGEFYGETAYDSHFTTPAGHIGGSGLLGGVTFVAASGDSGARSGVSYPAASPNVLSVGATTLYLDAGSNYAGELGWAGSTGGFSALETAPAYQGSAQSAAGLSYGLRTQPDVSGVGDPATGVAVYDSISYAGRSGWFAVGGTSAAAPQWAGLIAVADQGLALARIGSLRNAQAALYAIPSSSFHDVTSGFNGYSARTGYDLVTGLGTPVANRVVAGLLATQGVYNVTGFPSPYLPSGVRGLSAQPHLVLTSSTSGGTTPGSTTATTIFPVAFPNVVVVIVTIGSSQVVVIVPATTTSNSLFATNSHPVQPQLPSPVSLPGPTLSTFGRFGQFSTVDSLTWRTNRSTSETEIAALIDVVEPFQVPVPAVAPNKAATPSPTGATAMLPPRSLPFLPRLDRDGPGADRTGADLSGPGPAAAPLPGVGREDESRTANAGPRVTVAAALCGVGYWLTLRDSGGRKRGWRQPRFDRAPRPGVRRCSLPLW